MSIVGLRWINKMRTNTEYIVKSGLRLSGLQVQIHCRFQPLFSFYYHLNLALDKFFLFAINCSSTFLVYIYIYI